VRRAGRIRARRELGLPKDEQDPAPKRQIKRGVMVSRRRGIRGRRDDRGGQGPGLRMDAAKKRNAGYGLRSPPTRRTSVEAWGSAIVCDRLGRTSDARCHRHPRRGSLMGVTQDRLAATVVERLRRTAKTDPLAWVPALGLDRRRHLLRSCRGDLRRASNPRSTRRARARPASLGTTETVEIRVFRPNPKTGALGPAHGTEQTVYGRAGPGSQLLRPAAGRQYGVRLTAD
jgi:hypothetical protein